MENIEVDDDNDDDVEEEIGVDGFWLGLWWGVWKWFVMVIGWFKGIVKVVFLGDLLFIMGSVKGGLLLEKIVILVGFIVFKLVSLLLLIFVLDWLWVGCGVVCCCVYVGGFFYVCFWWL